MKQDNFRDTKQSLLEKLSYVSHIILRYKFALFLIFIVLLYGLIVFRVNVLNSAHPSAEAVDSQVKSARLPHIDQSVVDQLETLRDNSVNVQALFDQERNNPFQQ